MPARLDHARPFVPVGIAVVTVSDTRTPDDDESGTVLAERLTAAGHNLAHRSMVQDDGARIEMRLRELIADESVDVVLTTGGTGVTGRDVTPEALDRVCDKYIPGFGELFRMLSYEKVGTSALQSRAGAGVAGATYLFVLPGSPSACRDAWDGILAHQLDFRHRPCNFVELLPRLREGALP